MPAAGSVGPGMDCVWTRRCPWGSDWCAGKGQKVREGSPQHNQPKINTVGNGVSQGLQRVPRRHPKLLSDVAVLLCYFSPIGVEEGWISL